MATLPPEESVLVDELGLYQERRDTYLDLIESICNQEEWALRTLLGGYPDQIQGDMMVECELVGNGLYCGDGSASITGFATRTCVNVASIGVG